MTAETFDVEMFVLELNAAGSLGWEVVTVAAIDPTIGMNRLTAILKWQVPEWLAREDQASGWHPDPTGRFTLRHWT